MCIHRSIPQDAKLERHNPSYSACILKTFETSFETKKTYEPKRQHDLFLIHCSSDIEVPSSKKHPTSASAVCKKNTPGNVHTHRWTGVKPWNLKHISGLGSHRIHELIHTWYMIYVPTFFIEKQPNVGKHQYTRYITYIVEYIAWLHGLHTLNYICFVHYMHFDSTYIYLFYYILLMSVHSMSHYATMLCLRYATVSSGTSRLPSSGDLLPSWYTDQTRGPVARYGARYESRHEMLYESLGYC